MAGVTPEYMMIRRQRRLPPAFHRFGRKILYRRDDITEWLASTRTEPSNARSSP